MKSKYHLSRYAFKVITDLFLVLSVCPRDLVAQQQIEMSPGITTEFTGHLFVETAGHWLHQGTLLPGHSTITLNGTSVQTLQQMNGTFYNLVITKSGGHVSLGSNIHVDGGQLSLMDQDLLLNGHTITLDSIASLMETSGNTVKDFPGFITTSRDIPAAVGLNIAGMGLSIGSGVDLEYTELKRGHIPQSSNGVEGILRYYDILPLVNQGVEVSLTFEYDESELNGNEEADLKMYSSPDAGINWIEKQGVLDTVANHFHTTGVNWNSRFTLSSHCLETCIATQASTQSANVYLNSAGLALLLPADVNNGSRGACGIDTLTVAPETFECGSIGFQEILFTITDNNGCEKTAIAVVQVIDTIPPVMLSKDITVHLDELCSASITAWDVDNGSSDACGLDLDIDISTFDCDDVGTQQVVLTGMDPSGNMGFSIATITVIMLQPEIECQDAIIDIGDSGVISIDPFALISGDPDDYTGFVFEVTPATFYCEDLGDHEVTLTVIDLLGDTSTCVVTVHLIGPDADCDQVADACDACDGGDDQQDSDQDGLPDCADWDGWGSLIEEWQCANNKVFLCHDGILICVNQNAVQPHLDHGDFMGPCHAVFCEDYGFQVDDRVHSIPFSEEELQDYPSADPGPPIAESDHHDVILVENFPNPFFPETVIRFYLPARQFATLSVFDFIGKPLVRLAEGVYEKGWHEFRFDGSDDAEGMYFYSVRTEDQVQMKSMVLVRK